MSKVDIIVPAAGESVTEADLVEWKIEDGAFVEMDTPLLELETDKASMDLTAEASGTVTISVEDGVTVKVGDVLGTIDTSAVANVSSSEPEKTELEAEAGGLKQVQNEGLMGKESSSYAEGTPSPAAAKVLAEKGVSAAEVSGTGKDGRITKGDALKADGPVASGPRKDMAQNDGLESEAPKISGAREIRRERMSRLRKTVAKHLVEAQHTQALLTTFNEVDMQGIMDLRKKYKEKFKETYGVNLGFMSFFTKAVTQALKEFPVMNAQIDGDEILFHDFADIGIAVSSPKGLVVPVIRNAEGMSFQEIEQTILDYAFKARDGKLTLEDMEGGTFTITNGGTFGSMMSTPIVNFPQSAILGMHNIVKRPVVVGEEIVVKPMMYLAVSYDHRIIDGADAVRFLVRIKEQLEDPARLMIGL